MLTRRYMLAGLAASCIGPSHARADEPRPRIAFSDIAPGVWVATGVQELFSMTNHGFISNSVAIAGRDCVALIDTGGSMAAGRALLAGLSARTGLPVRYVINTHMHPDHIFGNAAFEAPGVTFAGSSKLPRALAARGARYLAANEADLGAEAFAGTRVIPPTLLVDGTRPTQLDLGDRPITLRARRTSHTDNDLTIRDEATGTLILGDLLFSGHIPVVDGSVTGWLALMDELAQEPAQRVVPGHGPASMPWPQALGDQRRYLQALVRDVRAVIKAGGTLEQALRGAGESERGKWLLFDDFHGRNISAAFAELEWE